MPILVLALALAEFALPGPAQGQERFLEDIEIDYDASVRCAGVYGAAATGKEMQHSPHHPEVPTYRQYEAQFVRYTQRLGPQLRIPDPITEEAVDNVRGEAFRPVREAMFAGDEPGFNAGLEALYALIPDCEAERVRLSRSIGIS